MLLIRFIEAKPIVATKAYFALEFVFSIINTNSLLDQVVYIIDWISSKKFKLNTVPQAQDIVA
jgi:hypothetical protein